MDICIAFQLYLAMAQSHVDVAANHVKIADAGKWLQTKCEDHQKKQKKVEGKAPPKIDEEKIETK